MSVYAIVEVGGRQWKVEPGTRLDVNRIDGKIGTDLPVDQVLLTRDGEQIMVGRPLVAGAKVICEVVEHHKGPKEITYYFRRREHWRKTVGHRQPLTKLIVKDIHLGGKSALPAKASAGQATSRRATGTASIAAKRSVKKTASKV